MILWLDAQLPPALAKFLSDEFSAEVYPLRDIGLRDAEDTEIFHKARKAGAVLVTKDSDFIELVERLGTPPQILWVTCGNVTNKRLCDLFSGVWSDISSLLQAGEKVIEVAEKQDLDF